MRGWTHGIVLRLAALAVAFGGLSGIGVAQERAPGKKAGEKIKINKLDDLPKHTYPMSGNLVELLRSEEQIRALGAKVRADIEADLAAYEIGDANTLQRMYGTLANVDLLDKKYDAVLENLKRVRELETKEAKKLMTGLFAHALIDARRAAGEAAPPEALRAAFRTQLAQRVEPLPWKTVEDEIQQAKGQLEIFSENLVVGMVQSQMQPVVEKTGELIAEQAASLIGMHVMLKLRLPLKDEIVAVYQAKIDANKVAKTDIWAARAVALSHDEGLAPVLLGVWDSGTDPAVFKTQLWTNPKETEDGQDNDKNGYVDDVHGIAYDIAAQRATGLLCPLEDAAGRMPNVMKHMKGFTDLQAAVDSPEAQALKKHLASLSPDEVKGFIEDLGLGGNYSHGTHVAGIMVAGNPFARLLVARLSYDHRTIPIARTVEWGARDAAKCRDTVAYFKQQGVRVVNMSWGEAQRDAEESLEKNGIGKDADERREIARQVFKLQRDGLFEALQGAPDILFVVAAGNADNDVEFDEDIPSSFDLPNVLVVGAVDQAGEPTGFTSFGRTVRVYANGFEVESYIPGGERMQMSGTSMASPNAANLAGKILAINPKLKPAEVIDLILKGSEQKSSGGKSYRILDPKRTVELAREKSGKGA